MDPKSKLASVVVLVDFDVGSGRVRRRFWLQDYPYGLSPWTYPHGLSLRLHPYGLSQWPTYPYGLIPMAYPCGTILMDLFAADCGGEIFLMACSYGLMPMAYPLSIWPSYLYGHIRMAVLPLWTYDNDLYVWADPYGSLLWTYPYGRPIPMDLSNARPVGRPVWTCDWTFLPGTGPDLPTGYPYQGLVQALYIYIYIHIAAYGQFG